VQDEQEVMDELREVLAKTFGHYKRITVLDAGCGRRSQVIPPVPAHVVGIDVSPEELAKNTDADETILGDLQTYPLPANAYDLIVCWDVLEHLRDPEPAIRNLMRALKPSGAIVVKVPNVASVKGLMTRWTPRWFHRTLAMKLHPSLPEDYEPFTTFHRFAIAPRSLQKQLTGSGLEVTYVGFYEAAIQKELRRRLHLQGLSWKGLRALARLTRGRLAVDATEFLIVVNSQ
jgi:SAM-dependent methyltransferase